MTSTPMNSDLEKHTVGIDTKSTEVSSHHHHHNGSRIRERLRHFLHPNDKRIHVAASPEEADALKKRLAQVHEDSTFDVYISGTAEHLNALREAQMHHEDRREELRFQHREVFEKFADVHAELDALASELDRVTTHGVALEAHFDRYGYSAHVRSYDDDSPGGSGSTTPTSSLSDKSQSPCERGFATPLKLFKIPTLRQYFHKGILWRSAGSEEVQSFELFVDLLYVGIIQINGDHTAGHPTGLSLLHFVITLTLSYKIWTDVALFISWFETDDVFQRLSILFLLACLFGYTTNIVEAFEHTYATLIGFYLAARLFMACYLLLCGYFIPMVRPVMIFHVAMTLLGAALWIGSVHVEWPNQLIPIFLALFVDLAGHVGFFWVEAFYTRFISRSESKNLFPVVPAINIEHRVERTNAFVSLVFGYTVVALLYQSTVNGIDSFYGKAILGLTQCFIFNWMYFEIDASNLRSHAIRRHKLSAFAWSMGHLPFIMTFVLGGSGLAMLVAAHDEGNTHLQYLTEQYQGRSEDHILNGFRWFYCGGFGVALIFMALISASHVHREHENIRLTKHKRLVWRVLMATVIVCLPLAHSLNSLELIGLVTGILVFLLVVELGATSDARERLVGRAKECQYFGRCSKRNLTAMVKSGQDMDVEELVKDKEKDRGCTVGT
ncbi:putative Low temperature requirement A [Septoria linicola]|nr:putative Low temperature requirement A [Septoria linicola]